MRCQTLPFVPACSLSCQLCLERIMMVEFVAASIPACNLELVCIHRDELTMLVMLQDSTTILSMTDLQQGLT